MLCLSRMSIYSDGISLIIFPLRITNYREHINSKIKKVWYIYATSKTLFSDIRILFDKMLAWQWHSESFLAFGYWPFYLFQELQLRLLFSAISCRLCSYQFYLAPVINARTNIFSFYLWSDQARKIWSYSRQKIVSRHPKSAFAPGDLVVLHQKRSEILEPRWRGLFKFNGYGSLTAVPILYVNWTNERSMEHSMEII